MVAEHGGQVPSDLAGLLALPGVGAYTARAVLAFAFEADVGVVDTNAGRVLSRAVAGRPVDRRRGPAAWWTPWSRPDGVVVRPGPLGPRGRNVVPADAPLRRCPIRRRCRWAARGQAGPDPAVGSAGVSAAQSRFAGSDRQGRGRLVDALRRGRCPRGPWPRWSAGEDDPNGPERVVAGLVGTGWWSATATGILRLP